MGLFLVTKLNYLLIANTLVHEKLNRRKMKFIYILIINNKPYHLCKYDKVYFEFNVLINI